jgi:hypothetical protein
LEGALSAPSPQDEHLFAFLALQFGSNGEERAQQHWPVIIGEFDQASLLNQTAARDPLFGSCPPLIGRSCVSAGALMAANLCHGR